MNNDFLSILKRMKEHFENEADTREGTWTADNLQAVANELARIYAEDIETVLPQAFVQSATGRYLDSCCSDYGFYRRAATAAEALVKLTGESGRYYGVMLYAGDISYEVLEDFTIPESGETTVRAVCSQTGDIGNVPAGSINKASTNRIIKVNNLQDATGGYDEESDESLRERTLEHIRTPANSGNIAHYRQWAKEISGVEKVKVYDLARGAGTVDVVIIADDNKPAPSGLIEAVEEHIENVRPVGADVLVVSGIPVDIKVTAEVVVQNGHTAAGIEANFLKVLDEYCRGISFQSSIISYLGIANLLFDCEGVVDVLQFDVNTKKESIVLLERAFPVAIIPQITILQEKDFTSKTGGDTDAT